MEQKSEHKFMEAKKLGNIPGLVDQFLQSPAHQSVVDFIKELQSSVKGMKISDVKKTENECLLGFDKLYEELEKIFKENPPKEGEERYEDPVFRRFHDSLSKKYDSIILNVLKPKKENIKENEISLELKTYFLDSFGNQFRLDYGTGHELNYLLFLYILYKVDYYKKEDFPYLVLSVFYRYVLFVRKLQQDYLLEPAGTRGVWGIDEFQFLPFIFGAGQFIGNKEVSPHFIKDDNILHDYKDENLFMSCVKHIKDVKHGASFEEYAPVLNSISKVRKWEKVADGLIKMYLDDVLKKFVVIQHFYFGSFLKLKK